VRREDRLHVTGLSDKPCFGEKREIEKEGTGMLDKGEKGMSDAGGSGGQLIRVDARGVHQRTIKRKTETKTKTGAPY